LFRDSIMWKRMAGSGRIIQQQMAVAELRRCSWRKTHRNRQAKGFRSYLHQLQGLLQHRITGRCRRGLPVSRRSEPKVEWAMEQFLLTVRCQLHWKEQIWIYRVRVHYQATVKVQVQYRSTSSQMTLFRCGDTLWKARSYGWGENCQLPVFQSLECVRKRVWHHVKRFPSSAYTNSAVTH